MRMPTILAALVAPTICLAPAWADGPDLAAGAALYAETCANCHGRAGRGMASFPSIAGREAEYLAERLVQYRAGERVGPNSLLMIPMAADLSDADIADLAAYVSTTFR